MPTHPNAPLGAEAENTASAEGTASAVTDAEVQQFRQHYDPDARGLSGEQRSLNASPIDWWEIIIGATSMLLWLVLLTAGILINTQPLREMASGQGQADGWARVGAWFVVVTCYTVTNLAFLSCFAAVIGGFCKRTQFARHEIRGESRPEGRATFKTLTAYYASIGMRGFVVYLMIIAGLFIITTSAIVQPDQGQYVRLAGALSVLAFLMGYKAGVFAQAINRIARLLSRAEAA